jgi:hypothetical protein
MLSAIVTNTITDACLTIFLLYVFIASLAQHLLGNKKFTRHIVLFFFTVLVIGLFATLAHYLTNKGDPELLHHVWLAISAAVVYLNYSVIYSIKTPDAVKMMVMFISLLCLYFFNITMQFVFIALSMVFIYFFAAVYSQKLTRIGFLAIVISNVLWIVVRKGINYELGYALPVQYRYDNDVYHVLIMFSVYLIYKSIKEGDWSYPSSNNG